jgi:hypothetical protein
MSMWVSMHAVDDGFGEIYRTSINGEGAEFKEGPGADGVVMTVGEVLRLVERIIGAVDIAAMIVGQIGTEGGGARNGSSGTVCGGGRVMKYRVGEWG